MSTLIENLNNIYTTKLQIKEALGTQSDIFSDYPAYITEAIQSAYGTTNWEEIASYGYIIPQGNQLITRNGNNIDISSYATIDVNIDMSTYVTRDELSAMSYITMNDVADCGYLTEIPGTYATYQAIRAMGYATQAYVVDYVATYAPTPDLSSYATKSYVVDYVATYAPEPDLSSYATKSYVVDYVATYGGSVTDENIIPNTNDTYTLGNHNYYYASTYSNAIGGYTGLFIKVNNNNRVYYGNSQLRPDVNNYINFGTSNYKWKSAYSYNYYLGDEGEIRDLFPSYGYVISYIEHWGQSGAYNLVDRVEGLEEKTTQLDYRMSYAETYISGHNYRIGVIENNYVNKTSLYEASYASTTYVADYVLAYASSTVDLTDYITYAYLADKNYLQSIPYYYITQTQLSNNSYVTETSLSSRGFLTQHQDLSDYATKAYVMDKIPEQQDLSNYITYAYLYAYTGAIVGDIETLLSYI